MAYQWSVLNNDGTVIHSGKGQYKKIDRTKSLFIVFYDAGREITTIDVEGKKFIVRRRVFFKNYDPQDIGAVLWMVGWSNGWLRRPTVYYINEETGMVKKDTKWIIKKPILRNEEK